MKHLILAIGCLSSSIVSAQTVEGDFQSNPLVIEGLGNNSDFINSYNDWQNFQIFRQLQDSEVDQLQGIVNGSSQPSSSPRLSELSPQEIQQLIQLVNEPQTAPLDNSTIVFGDEVFSGFDLNRVAPPSVTLIEPWDTNALNFREFLGRGGVIDIDTIDGANNTAFDWSELVNQLTVTEPNAPIALELDNSDVLGSTVDLYELFDSNGALQGVAARPPSLEPDEFIRALNNQGVTVSPRIATRGGEIVSSINQFVLVTLNEICGSAFRPTSLQLEFQGGFSAWVELSGAVQMEIDVEAGCNHISSLF